jgi:hypothetical protein
MQLQGSRLRRCACRAGARPSPAPLHPARAESTPGQAPGQSLHPACMEPDLGQRSWPAIAAASVSAACLLQLVVLPPPGLAAAARGPIAPGTSPYEDAKRIVCVPFIRP